MRFQIDLYRAEINPPPLDCSPRVLLVHRYPYCLPLRPVQTASRLQYFVQIGSPHKLLNVYIYHLKHFPKTIQVVQLYLSLLLEHVDEICL